MGLLMQELEVEGWKDVLELMYPEDEYKSLMDRTPLLAQQQDAALNPPPAPAMGGAPLNTGCLLYTSSGDVDEGRFAAC